MDLREINKDKFQKTTLRSKNSSKTRNNTKDPQIIQAGVTHGKIWIAINAIQTLKQAHKSFSTTPDYSPILFRLLKSDLLATLRELLRQDHCVLALHAFSAVRSEYNNPDLSLYADVATALARNRMVEDLDRLICDLETDCGGMGSSVTARGSSG
uniref:Uncharacterized protein n=1 Tax=Quercus lobata TaxID=97700 RepID=A0A7N2KQC0_QUELO